MDLTKRFIDHASQEYAVDTSRIYGTDQSMGALTTLILASQYTDLYPGTMIVDGQWDISALKGLESQNMVYFAADDDERASADMAEIKNMSDTEGISYASAEWNGNWSPDELTAATKELADSGENKLFVTWKSGTIDISDLTFQGSSAYHMASFDYAYNSIAMRE